MRIEDLSTKIEGETFRTSATIKWEDSDRSDQIIYFETDRHHTQTLQPDAFLVAACMPAMHYGEQRIAIQNEICPELKSNLDVAMHIVQNWYPKRNYRVPVIEATTKSTEELKSRDTAWFCSGGIDSWTSFYLNQQRYEATHPCRIKHGIFIYGFDFGKRKTLDERPGWNVLREQLEAELHSKDISLISVNTNIRQEFDEPYLWRDVFSGAALASVAHFLGEKISLALIASGPSLADLCPWAQHPLLDPHYSSYSTRIDHDGVHLSRLDKVKLLSPALNDLNVLKVCNNVERIDGNMLNCGRCEKCLRTMLDLLVAGKLAGTPFFPIDDVSADMIEQHVIPRSIHARSCYQELIEPLRESDRADLADAIQRALQHSQLVQVKDQIKTTIKGLLRPLEVVDAK
ncbi:MAG TPA: hypothetical protein V6C78_34630 [Crinalium sp.]|jgi:hypothetical protein